MNRLVIIGNGFDLAHGLPTSYKDFIDDYWANVKNSNHNDDFISFVDLFDVDFKNTRNLYELANFIKQFNAKIKFSDGEIYTEFGNNFMTGQYPRSHVLIYKNSFFKIVNQKNIQNWVDIENEYYRQLKKIINSKCLDVSKSEEFWENEQSIKVQKLNTEFEEIKRIFEEYLIEKIENNYLLNSSNEFNSINIDFYNILRPISVFNNESNWRSEFNNIDDVNEIEIFFKEEKLNPDLNKAKIRLLNFNYTSTLDRYVNRLKEGEIKVDLFHIHGKLNDELNLMNFGFGDEMDEDYKRIENINDNEYLRNFKSFQYLQNSNYSKLLNYIDSDKFQVLIMGHSCGLSDRTLLNTIFEHNNCRSIKVYYHQWEDKVTNELKDNYTEITQNISRHFNKKKLMREKIVNKTLCKPLPQIQLPKK
ncbi:MAG: bacteriophage abortive infection AbiH family protein [Flavobacterium sp.]|uniref:AbiH family protein n=1 Tax=Flavobacterium sp. TaxID=239 RepID=UPI0025BC7107|nr:AbiH family protein [Flavobacterium sp.]MCA1965241.1 bacteriophage abortive infection AbiH family protein [Flavobacterium sp.]